MGKQFSSAGFCRISSPIGVMLCVFFVNFFSKIDEPKEPFNHDSIITKGPCFIFCASFFFQHYRGSLKSLNTGIVTLLNYGKPVPPAVSHVTMAHEMGHNFGSPVSNLPAFPP